VLVFLETPRLHLHPITFADAEDLFALDNDSEVMRWLNGGIPTSRETFDMKILPIFLERNNAHPLFGFWAIESNATGEFLGWVSYRTINEAKTEVALGFRLKKSAWGYGYAPEAARKLIDKGFAESNVECVSATTYEKNLGSQKALEKLGMKLVRRFRYTEAELAGADTFHSDANELWDGNDLEYQLLKKR
jgi:RimJ/RimL family protein N-acetyltransferase